ncbi:GPP34 family phosphoprotein [Streptomyces sp. SS1-1]|uniref:GPP34 family phosphoprotein n=1 Tax=Streptomyces sp. SS1-1 TaxID=2651869 RepID=UPI00124FE8FE|nr:GPP34 family phosphoprotein [Streptomyces sp. SS1-1]KAB2975899.1 GPP34 family phosphoprotein [Streptomyces sp. SS1-1]
MNTARDLAIVALDLAQDHRVEQGELSLALAAAEVFDLLDAGALTLAEDRIAPNAQAPTGDRLLDEAATALIRQEPYESVEDWLWRRGRGLSAAYVEDLEQTGTMSRSRGFRLPLRAARTVPGDPAARQRAEQRWTSREPLLAALGAAAGIGTEPAAPGPGEGPADTDALTDDTSSAVLAALGNAVMELEAVRQRRAIEDAAFDNVWRGF